MINLEQGHEEKGVNVDSYNPQGDEYQIQQFLKKRIEVLKSTKKSILDGIDYEQIMKDADREYTPRRLGEKNYLKNSILVQDEIKGLRGSRLVNLGELEGGEWRSDVSEPTLMVKIQTALSILIDRNPEAVFKALVEKYENNTKLAQALWKRSWTLGKSKRQLKLFIFDLAKYGWAIGHTFPLKVERKGEVLRELDIDNPEKNKYDKKTIVEFNDVFREKLDPYRTWIDDMTNLTDPWSMDDWYYEKDYSYDTFRRNFKVYDNFDLVQKGSKPQTTDNVVDDLNDETKKRDDIVTVGFYEGKNKDLYGMWIPNQDLVLYYSPLPNDDKKLSCWHTYWNIRDPRTPYGIGLYEIIKNNKILYDRLNNMTIDQLTMAIYPMLFYSGNNTQGSGEITVSPGLVKQKLPGTTIDQVKIDYDPRGWEGVGKMKENIDENSGITPTLQGEVQGKTLGEVLHAKDAALKRLSTPLGNIAEALEDEACIALSWMYQIYSVPEVMEFTDEKMLQEYEEEKGQKAQNTIIGENGKITADFYKNLQLGLQKEDREGNLVESPEDRYFQIGEDIETRQLKWEGQISIQAMSIIAPSQELERQRKVEIFNVVAPQVQAMAGMFYQKIDPNTGQPFTPEGATSVALAMYKPIKQILEINDEKPENWIPDEIVKLAENPEAQEQMKMQEQQVKQEEQAQDPMQQLFIDQGMLDEAGQAPNGGQPQPVAQPVVPQGEVSNPVRKTLSEINKVR
jgi:hypothetical protein